MLMWQAHDRPEPAIDATLAPASDCRSPRGPVSMVDDIRHALHADQSIGSPFRGLMATQALLTAVLGLAERPSLTRVLAMSGNDVSDALVTVMMFAMIGSSVWLIAQNMSLGFRLHRSAFLPFHLLTFSYLTLAAVTHDILASWPLTVYYLAMACWSLFGSVAAQEVKA